MGGLAGLERFDPKMKKEDDEERRGKADETGRTKRIQLRIFDFRTLPASKFWLRQAACCPCAVSL
jgi:hypothetical protein